MISVLFCLTVINLSMLLRLCKSNLEYIRLFLFQVVGGMVWCISVCSYDVDVDLLFQENSSIGQKMFVFTLYTDSIL